MVLYVMVLCVMRLAIRILLITREECGTGLALGFGVGWGCGLVFEDVVGADECERLGIGLDEVGACGVDALHARLGAFEAIGFEEVGECGQGDVVEVAEVERRDGGVEEVVEEGFGERGQWAMSSRQRGRGRMRGVVFGL